MLTFWIIATLFVVFTLWFILPPLLNKSEEKNPDDSRAANVLVYQDQLEELGVDLKNGLISQEQYQQDKDDLERRLLEDVKGPEQPLATSTLKPASRKLAYGVATAIPIGAIALYLLVGNPKALSSSPAPTGMPESQPGKPMTPQQIAANVDALAKRLEQNPNDLQGWLMLARSYSNMGRFSDGASAYARALVLNERDADIWVDYAEALALANGKRLAGKPIEALDRALQIDAGNQRALDLAGSAAYQLSDYKKAIDYWQRLLATLPAGSEEAKTVSAQVAKARELADGKTSR